MIETDCAPHHAARFACSWKVASRPSTQGQRRPRNVAQCRLHAAGVLALLAALGACSGPSPRQAALLESSQYAAHARRDYYPPGPPEDPWGPYIREAAARYDIPETWVRAVMRVESGGHEYLNGDLVTSGAGAMGLMQVMPATYDGLRERYNLGDDPFDPHDNILAGVAYMREMYEIYGTPGFLAAYNAGPSRLDDYLANVRPLPDETRRYVAMIGPNLRGIYPNNRSAADEYAMNNLPLNIPPGKRYGRPVMLAGANGGGGGRVPKRAPLEVAQLPEPPRFGGFQVQQFALVTPPPAPPPHGGFHLIATASAAEAPPLHHGAGATGQWAIQIGAYGNEGMAQSALASAREHAHVELAVAHSYVANVHQGRTILWRARMTGMSRDAAVQACEKLTHGHSSCIVLSPDAQI